MNRDLINDGERAIVVRLDAKPVHRALTTREPCTDSDLVASRELIDDAHIAQALAPTSEAGMCTYSVEDLVLELLIAEHWLRKVTS